MPSSVERWVSVPVDTGAARARRSVVIDGGTVPTIDAVFPPQPVTLRSPLRSMSRIGG